MKALILWGIGMSGGIAVAAGLFTFLVITGIPHRLMTITHTTAYGGWYEWMFWQVQQAFWSGYLSGV